MDTIVRPIDVAKVVISRMEDPEIVNEGLKILRLCAANRDLINKAVGGIRFGVLVENFTTKVETDDDPAEVIPKFPEWAVKLKDTQVSKDFLGIKERPRQTIAVKSMANSLVGSMSGSIMYVDMLFEVGSEQLHLDMYSDKQELKVLRSIKGNRALIDFLLVLREFYTYMQGMITNHTEEIKDLDEKARASLQKKHWRKLLSLKDSAKEIMLTLPEEISI